MDVSGWRIRLSISRALSSLQRGETDLILTALLVSGISDLSPTGTLPDLTERRVSIVTRSIYDDARPERVVMRGEEEAQEAGLSFILCKIMLRSLALVLLASAVTVRLGEL